LATRPATLLRVLAGVLRRSIRADDLVARYGGEEFVVLLGGRPREVQEAMERIRLKVEDRFSPVDDNPVRRQVTVSVGIAALNDNIQTLEELIEAADEAMYRAKRAGKNRVAGATEAA
jgi:diguanylate cyclase (GGDEF)-like protein